MYPYRCGSLPVCCSTSLVFKTSLQTSETWNLGTFLNFDIGGDWKVDGDKKKKERYSFEFIKHMLLTKAISIS